MSLPRPIILTIGHSTRPADEFLFILNAHGVQQLIDVRTIPKSRRNPQYGRESLEPLLEHSGIHYQHMKALGGLRRPGKDSPNSGWRNDSFRGYADYMQTPEFASALDALTAAANDRRIVIMCAEAVPWRCHRSLIGDALTVRGHSVEHIMSATKTNPHVITSFARVEGVAITYPGLFD